MKKLSILAACALVALTLTGTAQAAGSTPKLLTKFQPVLVFHPGEEFRPTTVESFVRDSGLEAATSPTTWTVVNPDPTVDDLPIVTPPVWRLNQEPCFPGAPPATSPATSQAPPTSQASPSTAASSRTGRASSCSTGSSTTTTSTATRSCRSARSGSRTRATGRS